MAAAHTPQQPRIRRWNRYSSPISFTQTTSALKAPPDTTQVLWSKLLLRLEEEQLCLEDLPATEEPVWGTLYELGFTSYLERGRVCKQINAIRAHSLQNIPPTVPPASPQQTASLQTRPAFCHDQVKEAWTLPAAQHTKWRHWCAKTLKTQHFGFKCNIQ